MELNDETLNRLLERAADSPRLRMNFNLHDSEAAPSQRLLNALLPGTQIAVHRHLTTAETYIVVRGHIEVMFHADNGEVTSTFDLDPKSGRFGVNIPAGQWHSLRVVEPTVIFETKDGPYMPLTDDNILNC